MSAAIDNQLIEQLYGARGLTSDLAAPLTAIARRLIEITANYTTIPNNSANRRALLVRIEGFIGDLDQLHPVTLRPLIEHRHFWLRQKEKKGEPEAIRLLRLVVDVRNELKANRSIQESTTTTLVAAARECKPASAIAKNNPRSRSNWIGPVVEKFNLLKSRNPRRSTSSIAKEIADDPVANPTGKKHDAIRKALGLFITH